MMKYTLQINFFLKTPYKFVGSDFSGPAQDAWDLRPASPV